MDVARGFRRSALALLAAALAAGLSVGVAGCGAAGAGAESAPPVDGGPSSAATPTETAGAELPTPTAAESPTPVDVACDAMVTPQALYDFNPNYGADPDYAPHAAAAVAAAAADGTACGWLNQTSGAVIETAVAAPAPSQLASLHEQAAAGTAVPDWGDGWFAVDGDIGTAQVFTGAAWVVVASGDFVEPADAGPLVQAVLAGR